MDDRVALPQRLVEVLEALLRIPTGNLKNTLTHAADLLARLTGSDKVDGFLYDPARDCLVSVGSSIQPLSTLQRQLGLDVLQLSNGGRVVHVFKTGETFVTGNLQDDPEELRGVKEGLKIRSKLGVPLAIGGQRRGMVMLASLKPDYFTPEDVRLAESAAQWVSVVAHRAELQEQAASEARMQGRRAAAEELVGALAHDLRNLLTPLVNRIELLRQSARGAGRPEDEQDAEAAARAVERLARMVEDMLELARIEEGTLHFDRTSTDVGALVHEAARALETPGHPLLVRVQDGDPILVIGDAQRLRQCLQAVISQGIVHSAPGASVSVFVVADQRAAHPGWVRIDVQTEGTPGAGESAARAFEAQRVARRGGLALYLARAIARAHGGDLEQNAAEGGTRFTLTLRRS